MAGTPRRKPGWMGPFIEGLRAWLLERGYTPGSTKYVLTLAGQLGRWMQTADVKFSQLDSAAVASFLDALRARGVRRVPGPRGLRPLLDYLDNEGALAFKPIPDSPVEQLVASYRTWLVVDRGLAAATVLRYENQGATFAGAARFGRATFASDARFDGARVLYLGTSDQTSDFRVWPNGWTVRADADDPSCGTLIPAEPAER